MADPRVTGTVKVSRGVQKGALAVGARRTCESKGELQPIVNIRVMGFWWPAVLYAGLFTWKQCGAIDLAMASIQRRYPAVTPSEAMEMACLNEAVPGPNGPSIFTELKSAFKP